MKEPKWPVDNFLRRHRRLLKRSQNSCSGFWKLHNGQRTLAGVAPQCFGARGSALLWEHHCWTPTLLNSRVQHQHQQRRVERLGGDLASSFSSRLICWRRQPSISDIWYIIYLISWCLKIYWHVMQAILTSYHSWQTLALVFKQIWAHQGCENPVFPRGGRSDGASSSKGAFYSQSIEDRPHTGHQVGSSLLDREIYFQED